MAISRQQKQQIVKDLVDNLSQAKSTVLASFANLTVNDDQSLRGDLREAEVNYQVVKKTLLKKAMADAKLENINLTDVRGNLAVALADDEVGAAKVLHKFAQDNEGLSIIAGYLESVLIDKHKISELALLPSKEELLAQTIATINAPVQNFVGVLSANVRNLVYVLNAVKEQRS